MPAFADIVINDGETTPVAHTFKPTELREGLAVFHDRSGGVAIGYPMLTFRLRPPPPANSGEASDAVRRAWKLTANVSYPIMESTSAATGTGIAPAPTIAYVLRVNMEWNLPERSTLQNRKNLWAFAYNLLNHATFKNLCQDLENIY